MNNRRHRTAVALLAKLGTQSLVPISISDIQVKPAPDYTSCQKSIIFFDPTDAELNAIYSGQLSGSGQSEGAC